MAEPNAQDLQEEGLPGDNLPEQNIVKQAVADHANSIVKITLKKIKKGKPKTAFGTGFIVEMNSSFCLIMSCGHVLDGFIPGTVQVSIGNNVFRGYVVFSNAGTEVSMVRVNQTDDPEGFSGLVDHHPPVGWSIEEAPDQSLVAIMSILKDPEGDICVGPSAFHGYIVQPVRFAPKAGKKIPLHLGSANYISVPGSSGSPIFSDLFSETLQVVGIHVAAKHEMAHFVCLEGVITALKKYMEKLPLPPHGNTVSDLLAQIVQREQSLRGGAAGISKRRVSSSSLASSGQSLSTV